MTLANGQRVNGARPAYLLRREAQQPQQHQSQSQQQNAHSRYNASHSSGMSDNGSGAVVTDLSADETSSGSGGDGSGPGKQFESDLVVVLDMDECLIHSQFLSQQAKSFSAPELDNSSGDDGDGAVQQEDKYRQSDLRPTKSSAFHTDGEEAESIIAANCEYFRIPRILLHARCAGTVPTEHRSWDQPYQFASAFPESGCGARHSSVQQQGQSARPRGSVLLLSPHVAPWSSEWSRGTGVDSEQFV